MGLFWTMRKSNYGREAAAYWNQATIGNNNYSREAAAFLKAPQLGPRSGRLLELGNHWEQQQLGPRSGRLFEGKK